jgi:hypothetical protein
MKTVTRRTFASGIALIPSLRFSVANAQAGVTPAETRQIAKEAYIYGFPLVDSYRIQYDYFVDRDLSSRHHGVRLPTRLAFTHRRTQQSRRPTRIRPIPGWASTCARSLSC